VTEMDVRSSGIDAELQHDRRTPPELFLRVHVESERIRQPAEDVPQRGDVQDMLDRDVAQTHFAGPLDVLRGKILRLHRQFFDQRERCLQGSL
jgi:hypothetical protein